LVKSNDFERQWREIEASVMDAVRAVGESGWYILGPAVEAFERDLCAWWGRRFAIGVGSGLDAIEIGLKCAGCLPGDRVLVAPVSAFATALAVVKLGATPVFVDCDRYGLVDLDLVEDALCAGSSIPYFLPVHLYGHCLDMARLRHLSDRFGIKIVEDCAQSIGASHQGTACGTAGGFAATSFYPTKNLGAFGDGGALLTDSDEAAASARCLRDYGQSAKYQHTRIGYNSRLDELHASVLRRALLPRVHAWNAVRRNVADRYIQGIQNPLIAVLGAPAGSCSAWHLFPVLAPAGRKAELLAHLRGAGVLGSEHYPRALMDQPVMQRVPYEQIGPCSVAREFCGREVSLPIHPYLSAEEVAYVIDVCNSWN
jgi:dTDP-4-amino-4,6-dideoxygalactose transaminase